MKGSTGGACAAEAPLLPETSAESEASEKVGTSFIYYMY